MARKIHYRIYENGINAVADSDWESVLRLQHWYNSEFIWTAGKLLFKMFVVFPNPAAEPDEGQLWRRVMERRRVLKEQNLLENEIIRIMEKEGLTLIKKGGYFDDCLASGFTRMAGNEWNAFLVCEFLLKASMLLPQSTIDIFDDGHFIKTRHIRVHKGHVALLREHEGKASYYQRIMEHHRVFSIVDPAKYEHYPLYQSVVQGFNSLDDEKRNDILRDFHWLGFESNYDLNGDDIQGVDLNKKVLRFSLEDL